MANFRKLMDGDEQPSQDTRSDSRSESAMLKHRDAVKRAAAEGIAMDPDAYLAVVKEMCTHPLAVASAGALLMNQAPALIRDKNIHNVAVPLALGLGLQSVLSANNLTPAQAREFFAQMANDYERTENRIRDLRSGHEDSDTAIRRAQAEGRFVSGNNTRN